MLHSIHSPAKEQTSDNPTVVMLHGRGADEQDLFGLKEYLDPRLSVYSVRAPFNFGWGGFAWFELFEDGSVDEESFRQSREQLLDFIHDLDTKQLYILGFSMGAIISYAITLTQPNLCKGIVCLSGFAPLQLEDKYKLNELQNLNIFISHGINDPIIPISAARKTKELLDTSNAIVTYKEYSMGHEIGEECLMDVTNWFQLTLT
jgi:phospholipase/carboxylesterase